MSNTVLIVDDEPGIRDSLRGLLEDEGFEVETVSSGERALDALAEATYACILLDIMLPNVDGLTVLHECLVTMPGEDFLYLGDGARCPYGPRDADEIRRFALEIGRHLERSGVKLIVVACNTAAAAALPYLQERLEVPVVAVLAPEAHVAVQATRNRHVGVLATEATVASGRYADVIHALHHPELFSSTALQVALQGGGIGIGPNSGALASRGGRCIRSLSAGSFSNATEQAGSMMSSSSAMCIGNSRAGQPNSTGSSAMPAIGTCTARM